MSDTTTHTTVIFSAIVNFEMTEAEAAHLLSDPKPDKALMEWFSTHPPAVDKDFAYNGNTKSLFTALGEHLAKKIVSDAKQLPMSTDATIAA